MQDQQSNDIIFAPVCEVCKSQDESLRAVTYPFLFSVIFATFQRTFSGVFCAKHQRRYHILASLITATAGWLGIPYGFIMTPLTLFKLARGGIVHTEQSVDTLNQIAEKKLRLGDRAGTIRCLEESLKLQDNLLTREKLGRLYQQSISSTDKSFTQPIWQIFAIPVLLILALIIGVALGFVDTIVIWLIAPLFGSETSIILAIVSWLPTVSFLFGGVLFARAILRWSLQKTGIMSVALGSLISFTSTALLFYSVLEGQLILRNLEAIITFFSISKSDGIFAVRSLLSHGGLDTLVNDLSFGLTGVIFVVLWTLSILLSLYSGMETVVQICQWQNRMNQVRHIHTVDSGNSSVALWSTYGVIIFAFAIIIALIYPGHFVNIEKVYEQVNLGVLEADKNNHQQALTHFSQVADMWPDSVTGHMYMGLGYSLVEKFDDALRELDASLQRDPDSIISYLFHASVMTAQGKFADARSEFEIVSNAQPEWALPHALLAVVYLNLDERDLAQKEIETAIKFHNEDQSTLSMIGSYYLKIQDFQKAEEYYLKALKLSNKPEDYLSLAHLYIHQSDFERAKKIIDEANRLGGDTTEVILAKKELAASQNDFEQAETLLRSALNEYPENSSVWTEISYVHFKQGKFDIAVEEAKKAVELNPYNGDAYVELAFALQAQGQQSEALATAQKGISLSPISDRAHYIMGLCYMDQGVKEEAINEFQTFLDLYWDRPLAREYKQQVEKYLEQLR